MKLSIYRLFLAAGTLLILFGAMMATDVLAGSAPLDQDDLWMLVIPFGVGALFILQALLRRRFVGIERDRAPGWGQIAGTLGLAFLAAFGGTEWLDSTLGDILGAVVFVGLLLLALGALKWLPRPWNNKG